jgi:hypothetical protein
MNHVIVTTLILSIATLVAYSDPLDVWTWRNPLPSGNRLTALVFGGGQFVAVGEAGLVMTSANGVDWIQRQSGTLIGLSAITYGQGQFVAVGTDYTVSSGVIVTSSDGINWIRRDSNTTNGLAAVAYANDLFVAVGYPGVIVTSSDGINWLKRESGTSIGLNGIAYGSGRFVAVGCCDATSGKVVINSINGIGWSESQPVPHSNLLTVAYGNGQFIAADGQALWTSPDGIFWAPLDPEPGMSGYASVVYQDEEFIAVKVPHQGDPGQILTSRDGVSWLSSLSLPDSSLPFSTVYGNGMFVALDGTGTGFLTSVDATSWTSHPYQTGTLNTLNAVAYGNGQFVIASYSDPIGDPGSFFSSADGISWIQRLHWASGRQVVFGNGRFVAPGFDQTAPNAVWTSTDGTNWVEGQSGFVYGVIAYGNDQFIVTSWDGSIEISKDGINWVQRFSGGQAGTQYLTSIAFGNGQFVGVGYDNCLSGYQGTRLLTSPDGVHWVQQQTDNGGVATAITFGNNRFVAVGAVMEGSFLDHAYVSTSPDGVSWISSAFPNYRPLSAVAYGAGQFVAVGIAGEILSSRDGLNWTHRKSGASLAFLNGVGYGNGHFIAVGYYGTILQSDPILNLVVGRDLSTGVLSLLLEGPSGLGYTIQSSNDLVTWQDVTTITGNPSGKITLDGLPIASGNLFYRARSQ